MKRLKKNQLTLEDSFQTEQKQPSKLSRFLKSRRAKYGSVAAIFTAVVLLATAPRIPTTGISLKKALLWPTCS